MEIYLSKIVTSTSFAETEILVKEKLKEQGFGVITEIDVQTTFKNKIGIEFRPYKILGACNPNFAFEAISNNDKIGVMLPCNVCLQQLDENTVEIFTINPLVAMQSMNDSSAKELAGQVYEKLNQMLAEL
jgi:uncharacterized protein (DUF302 family)